MADFVTLAVAAEYLDMREATIRQEANGVARR
jgi:hypothetical protein